MIYTPPVFTDAGGSITTGYSPPAFTDAGGDVILPDPEVPALPVEINLGELRMFPLEIADIVYTMRDFLNGSYTEGVPGSANSIIRHLTIARTATGSDILYPSLGTHTIRVSQHRVASVGQSFKATSPEGGEFYGKVVQYNPYTGFFRFKVENISVFLPSNSWSFDFRTVVDIPSSGANNLIIHGMTSAYSQDGVSEAFELHNIKSPWVYFEDFRGPFGLPNGIVSEGTGYVSHNSSSGVTEVSVTSASTHAHLHYGNTGFFSISSVGKCVFEARVKHPSAVSSVASSYATFVGLKGEGSLSSAPFTLAGMGFYCLDTENGGNWICFACNDGDSSSASTAVSPVASTYTTFRIVVADAEVTFYINGVLVATLTTIPVAPVANNLMSPLVGINALAALAAERTLSVDYLYLEVFGE